MIQRMMVRSFLVALVSLSLLAAPAFAVGPAQPVDSPRSGWMVELGDFLDRAVGLVFGDRAGQDERIAASDDGDEGGLRSVSGADECDAECEARGGMDPDG